MPVRSDDVPVLAYRFPAHERAKVAITINIVILVESVFMIIVFMNLWSSDFARSSRRAIGSGSVIGCAVVVKRLGA